MFIARLIGEVRKELNKLGPKFSGELQVVKIKEGVKIFRLENEETSYIVKYYDDIDMQRILSNLQTLLISGIKIDVVASTDNVLISEDYEMHLGYRRLTQEDLNDEEIVKNIARWYKIFHLVCIDDVYDYNNYFSLRNINTIIETLNLKRNAFFSYIIANFDNIKLKLNRIKKTVLYRNFSLENVMISCDNSDLFFTGLDTIYIGYRYNDIDNVLENIDKKYHPIFMQEYGTVSDDEIIINEVVGTVISLYFATKEKIFPLWGKKYLEKINDKKILETAKAVVNWY